MANFTAFAANCTARKMLRNQRRRLLLRDSPTFWWCTMSRTASALQGDSAEGIIRHSTTTAISASTWTKAATPLSEASPMFRARKLIAKKTWRRTM